ncbi:hypothetical protein TNCV_1969311 [Trichonephila clavipes]|nr:hypothetical protein TNCV_1969311 [Trichonephila clavipes]
MPPELVAHSPDFHTTPTGGRLRLDRLNVYRPPSRRVAWWLEHRTQTKRPGFDATKYPPSKHGVRAR